MARSELYNDFLIPNGVRYTYGLHLGGADGTSELLAILRGPDRPPFEDADAAPELEIVTRHIARAAHLRAGTRHLQAQAAMGMSPAEARLAQALFEGRELAQYAQDANVAINTARTQLRHIFDKTGCRRQTDLLRLLHALPALKIHAPG